MLFPYDQGGCTCRDCYPWGANGFFKIAKQKAAVAREIAPDTKIVLATWRFGLFCDGEWEAFVPAVKADGGWIDYLLVDVDFYIPDELFSLGIPVVSFPEISMHGAVPWGGFGANPFPALMGQRIAQKGERCQGGNMYSEGIYEDINKIVTLELFRDPSLSVKEILREYAAWYFDGQYTDELAALMLLLEETLPRSVRDRDGRACDYPVGPQSDLPTVKIMQPQRVEEIAQRFLVLDQKLPRQVRKSWRYRILYLRALGDAALVRNGGVPNEETDRYYGQLAQLFHGDEAYYFVGPFTRQAFLTNRSDGGEL